MRRTARGVRVRKRAWPTATHVQAGATAFPVNYDRIQLCSWASPTGWHWCTRRCHLKHKFKKKSNTQSQSGEFHVGLSAAARTFELDGHGGLVRGNDVDKGKVPTEVHALQGHAHLLCKHDTWAAQTHTHKYQKRSGGARADNAHHAPGRPRPPTGRTRRAMH